jgi:hypothetical protein
LKISNPVTGHVLLDVQTAIEVLASEHYLSCLMLTTHCLKAIVTMVPCCTYPEFATLSINYNELSGFPYLAVKCYFLVCIRQMALTVVRTSFKSAVLC